MSENTDIYSSKDYKISRRAYSLECMFEHFVALLVTDAFIAKLLKYFGTSDALCGIISSFISLSFLFQIFSVLIMGRIRHTKRTAIIFHTAAQFLFSCLYLIPFLPVDNGARRIIFIIGILAAYLYKGTLFRGEAVPFVMELPNYRLPGLRNVTQLLWEKAKDFLQRAFSVILIATIVVWFLQSFDINLHMVDNAEDSILAKAAGIFSPVMKPIGLGDWRILVSLVSGFMAKESVVSTLEILYGGGVTSAMTSLSAASLLVFSLLYTPCVAAVASIKRELGIKWAATVVVWQCVIAWMAALIIRAVLILIGVK